MGKYKKEYINGKHKNKICTMYKKFTKKNVLDF